MVFVWILAIWVTLTSLLTIFSPVIAIVFIIYIILRKFNHPRIAKYLIISLISGLIILFLTIVWSEVFENELFDKDDARKLLEKKQIILVDDFEIIKKESAIFINGSQEFTLEISEQDKKAAISEIKKSIERENNWQYLEHNINYENDYGDYVRKFWTGDHV